MSFRPVRILGRATPILALVAVLLLAPNVFGFSGGITKDSTLPPGSGFDTIGCRACHGAEPGPHAGFDALDNSIITVTMTGADGSPVNGPYAAGEEYVIQITLAETVAPGGGDAGNHAGFNLRVTGGELIAVPESSQVAGDATQATHVNARSAEWTVHWKAPASGGVAFQLFVNDVDGDAAPSPGDNVHQVGWWMPDHDGAGVGAAAEHEVHYGISLQQYWIGLIGLAGMLAVMVGGYLYLKYANPHNTDAKDR